MPKKLSSPKRHDPAPPFGWMAAGTLIAAIVGLSLWWWLSGSQTRLTDSGYELSKSLYAACNLEDTKRLRAAKVVLGGMSLAGEERQEILRIVDLAENGQWQNAASLAREILESQDTH